MTKKQKKIIEEHNKAMMKIITETSQKTGLDKCTLFYAAHFGIMGIW